MIDTPELPSNPRAEDHLERLRKIQMDLSTHLRHAQHTQKNYVDRHRLPSSFAIGDRVWLLRRHIKTTRPCNKLDYRRLGPFRITGKINDATFRIFGSIRSSRVLFLNLIKPTLFPIVLRYRHLRLS